MPRELKGSDGIVWECVQAYEGLSDEKAHAAAARHAGAGRVEVVCTPSGGAQTVRLELPADWEESLGDDELMGRIEARREKG